MSFHEDALNDAPLERLGGFVEKVTFQNEENGFSVLRIKIKGEKDLVTLVGYSSKVNAGEYVMASGQWAIDPKFGRQFKARSIKITPPTSKYGIEKYLGSGLVKGIGPIYAKKLVKAFGEKVFEVIENEPERLLEVEGIGEKRQKTITSGWADQKIVRDIMVFLQGNGISPSRAYRIFKTYGEDAIQKVTDNPYQLARDIRGIGFKTADTIAQNMGIEHDSPLRAMAGIEYTLTMQSQSGGHCCLTADTLIGKAVELLEINQDIITDALRREIEEHHVIQDCKPEPESIYLPPLFFSEISVAKNLKRIFDAPLPWNAINIPNALLWVEKTLGFQFSKSQKKAVETALQSKVMVITGGPGVGKTTIVKSIISILAKKKQKIFLCAPTGRAAKRLSESSEMTAKTIHRMLEFDPSTGGFKHNRDKPLDCDVLIVDECSMVDIALANSLLKAVPTTAAVILVGDVDQLPSVGSGKFLQDVIESQAFPVIRLTEIFRQAATSRIIRAAHQINEGNFPSLPAPKEMTDFYFVEVKNREQLGQTIVDLVKTRLPKAFKFDPVKDIQVLCPMNRGGAGAIALNPLLQDALNPKTEDMPVAFSLGTGFRPGDKVMQLVNNYDRDVFNGDIGFIEKIATEESEVYVRFDDRIVSYPFGELDELTLCYATTIHKSQGSEYPVVVLPISIMHYVMLKRNLLYTGVTRGKKLVVLVGEKRAIAMAVKDTNTMKRNTGLKDRLME